MNDDQYIRAARQVVEAAARRREKYKIVHCRDCRYRMAATRPYCVNPVVVLAAEGVDQGYDRKRLQQCDSQRSASSVWGPVVCGPNGSLFEPKVGWLARILGYTGNDHSGEK